MAAALEQNAQPGARCCLADFGISMEIPHMRHCLRVWLIKLPWVAIV
jgi:hypothetical protein